MGDEWHVNGPGVALPCHVLWLGVNKAQGASKWPRHSLSCHVIWLGVNKARGVCTALLSHVMWLSVNKVKVTLHTL